MSSRVSLGLCLQTRKSPRLNDDISPAIQTQKDDLKGQLSRLYDGPELREHRVRRFVV